MLCSSAILVPPRRLNRKALEMERPIITNRAYDVNEGGAGGILGWRVAWFEGPGLARAGVVAIVSGLSLIWGLVSLCDAFFGGVDLVGVSAFEFGTEEVGLNLVNVWLNRFGIAVRDARLGDECPSGAGSGI